MTESEKMEIAEKTIDLEKGKSRNIMVQGKIYLVTNNDGEFEIL